MGKFRLSSIDVWLCMDCLRLMFDWCSILVQLMNQSKFSSKVWFMFNHLQLSNFNRLIAFDRFPFFHWKFRLILFDWHHRTWFKYQVRFLKNKPHADWTYLIMEVRTNKWASARTSERTNEQTNEQTKKRYH